MDRLRSLFEVLGFDDVSTFIASGNVVFSADAVDVDALTSEIERHLERELGYEVATFLRTPAQLASVASPDSTDAGFQDQKTSSHYVMFLRAAAPESLRSELAALDSEMDDFQFSGAEIHWRVRGKVTDSPLFGGGLERATRAVPMTMRNMNTLRRMVVRETE